jgi:transposase
VRALPALKGVGPIVAATIVTEVGDFTRFTHPRRLVAYFGLSPGEHSSGSSVRPRVITKAGNVIAHRLGYDETWVAEHHSAGWEVIASPELFIAEAAHRTRNIRLSSAIARVGFSLSR